MQQTIAGISETPGTNLHYWLKELVVWESMNRQKERKCNPFPQAQTQTRHSLISFFSVCAYLWFHRAEFPEGPPLTQGPCSNRRLPPQQNLLPLPLHTLLCLQQPLAGWAMHKGPFVKGPVMSALSLQQARGTESHWTASIVYIRPLSPTLMKNKENKKCWHLRRGWGRTKWAAELRPGWAKWDTLGAKFKGNTLSLSSLWVAQ